MNKEQFLNKEIINKNNDVGVVISFDDEHIVVKYQNEEKTYCPDVAFKNKYLSFLDDSLNYLVDKELLNKEESEQLHEKVAQNNHKIAVNRLKKINELYKKMSMKNQVMKCLFGGDFQYPPFIEFVKKYKYYIDLRSDIRYPYI